VALHNDRFREQEAIYQDTI